MGVELAKFENLTVQMYDKLGKEFQSVSPKSEEYVKIVGAMEKIAPNVVTMIKEMAIEAQKQELEKQKLELESKKIDFEMEIEKKKIEIEIEKLDEEKKKMAFETKRNKDEQIRFWVSIGVTAVEFIILITFYLICEDWQQANTMTSQIAPKVLQMLPQVVRRTAPI